MRKECRTKQALNEKVQRALNGNAGTKVLLPQITAICLSGGIDSAVALGGLLKEFPDTKCIAISFLYPSKHNELELACAKKLAEHYGIQHIVLDVASIFACMNSSMISPEWGIPEGHYKEENMKSTVIPLRNLIFTTIAASNLMNMFPDKRILLSLGIHAGDHHIYPDCRLQTNEGLSYAIKHGSDGNVLLAAPFLNWHKATIVKLGNELKVPFELTRTCYTEHSPACGKCGSCVERLEAFTNNGLIDPIEYDQNIAI